MLLARADEAVEQGSALLRLLTAARGPALPSPLAAGYGSS